jgi:hypothetical protein
MSLTGDMYDNMYDENSALRAELNSLRNVITTLNSVTRQAHEDNRKIVNEFLVHRQENSALHAELAELKGQKPVGEVIDDDDPRGLWGCFDCDVKVGDKLYTRPTFTTNDVIATAISAMDRAKILELWDDIDTELYREIDIIFSSLTYLQGYNN